MNATPDPNEEVIYSGSELGIDLTNYAGQGWPFRDGRWLDAIADGYLAPGEPDETADGGFGDIPPEDGLQS